MGTISSHPIPLVAQQLLQVVDLPQQGLLKP